MGGIIADNVGRSSGLIKAVSVSAGLNLVHSTTSTSSVSSISLDNIFTSDYDLYLIHGYNITHASASNGWARVIKSDGSVDSGSNYQTVRHWANQAGTTGTNDYGVTENEITLGYDVSTTGITSFTGYMYNPQSTTYDKHFYGLCETTDATNIRFLRWTGTYDVPGTAVRGLNYLASTGNVENAEFRVYGLATS